jgi:hypothetical protein
MIKQLFTALGLVSLAATGACEAHETVRVREPVVTERVVVASPQPVVEQVVVAQPRPVVVEKVVVAQPQPVVERVVITQPQPVAVVETVKVAKPKVVEVVVKKPVIKETVVIH